MDEETNKAIRVLIDFAEKRNEGEKEVLEAIEVLDEGALAKWDGF